MKRIVCITECYWYLVDKRDAAKGGRLCKVLHLLRRWIVMRQWYA